MARPTKAGLDYINIDIDFFEDEKVEFISAKYGELGELIIIKLLLRIYRNGYYLKWGEDECFLFARRNGKNTTFDLVNDVVNELLKRDFFSKDKYKKYGILTSNGIQKRYIKAIERRKEINLIKEYLIVNTNINSDNGCINSVKSHKVKESKGKESKANKNKQSMCEKLSKKFIKSTLIKRSETPSSKSWARKLENFIKKEKLDKSRVKKVLLWYCSQFNKNNPYNRKYLPKFVPQSNSMSGFCHKFFDIEQCMMRMTNDKTDPNKKIIEEFVQ